ncbi:MAG: NAD(P)H-quinone oxidoreductase [Defluviicoccus sp.]|nr:NAD(P)H-quinone oxidoreductase [Defluviicoccus sp.]MDE0275803.1 NAD(P)H-quinone oxidoreductase [Defluviicoccus sp.]
MTQTVPASMKAIEISEPGGPDMLRPCTRPVPQPGEGEVLVKVAAAGVNYPDVAQRRGNYPPPPGASDLPGLEIAGTVVAQGPGVSGPAPGDEICALVSGGGYAEYCAVPVPQCLPIPDGLDTVRAAALPETFFTVWTNLFDGGRMKAGETVLIHGGSGGIGTTAIQIARAFGARVFATARTAEKCAFCEELGAERAINYAEEDFVAVVRELTEKRGVDLILDMVGGDYLARNVRALAVEGRLVQIAVREGAEATIPLGLLMVKRLVLTGSTLRPRTVAQKGAIAAALEREVWPLLAEGSVRPVVHATFALDEAAEAHALMESSAHIGKIVLTV